MAYKLNGKTLQADRGFTHDGVQYPRNWLVKSSQGDRDALGITWEADPVRADDRYYWDGDVNNPKALEDKLETKEDGTPLYVQVWNPDTEQMEDTDEQVVTKGLKSNMIAQVKDTAGKLLATTDWYVTRKVERNVDIPTDIASKRAAIVAESDRLETAIAGVTTVEALIEVMNSQDWGNE
jgi:hypothetical protein